MLWWAAGIAFFKTHDFHTNVAGGIALMSFLVSSLIITVILLVGFLIARKRIPDRQTIYKRYAIYLFLPYLLLFVFYGFQYIKTHVSNSYEEDLTNFNFEQNDVQNVMQLESSLNSTRIETETKYYLSNSLFPDASKNQLAQPLIFQRKTISLIPLQVDYYFEENDSIIKCVLYNWSGNYPYQKVSVLNDHGYRNKYKAIVANLKSKLGSPLSQSGDLAQDINEEFYTTWETDEITATLRMYLSLTTKRIRFTIYWSE